MNISDKGIELIKSFEGCRLQSYRDTVGVWTIGWGHTAGVYSGMSITQEKADEFLREDLKRYEDDVNKYDEMYHFNQNQFDALTSFAYNIGSIGQLTDYGCRSIETISEKILLYNKAGGEVLAGLTRRRIAEKALFDTPPASNVGWIKTGRGWKYYENGKALKSQWKTIKGKDYYFNSKGYMAYTEFIKSANYDTNKKLYYVNKDGIWDGNVYRWYLDVKGWWLGGVGTGWYAKSEWAFVDGKWYYFGDDGYLLVNTSRTIDGVLYEFDSDGALKD